MALLMALTSYGADRAAFAQVRQPGEAISAGDNSGPLSDVSRPLDDSRAVHDGAQTIGETSGASVRSGPVRDPGTRSMLSGPVSQVSRGPMTEPRPPLTSGSVTEASSGAVKHDIDSPLGERISSPLRELGPLQQAMRARREQAEQAALEGATEPAVPPIDVVPAAEAAAPAPDDAASAAHEVSDANEEEPVGADDAGEPEDAAQ